MTYPIESLAIVAPIIFIVLISLFPILGVLSGWKRACFWGGGFLLFYLLALVIWKIAGNAIAGGLAHAITELISKILQKELETLPTPFVASVIVPFWFLAFMILGLIVLIINYFAWYKRVVGLKKVKVVNPKTGEKVEKRKQYTKTNKNASKPWYKAINRVGGLVALGGLTIPSTVAFTQFAYIATTNTATKQTNKLSSNISSGLNKLSSKALFDTNVILDYDSLLSIVSLMGKNVTIGGVEQQASQVLLQGIGGSLTQVFTSLASLNLSYGPAQQVDEKKYHVDITYDLSATKEAVGNLADNWNPLFDQCETEMASVFDSLNVIPAINTTLLPLVLGNQMQKIDFSAWISTDKPGTVIKIDETIQIEIGGYQIPFHIVADFQLYDLLFMGETRQLTDPTYPDYVLEIEYKPLFQDVINTYNDKSKGWKQVESVIIPKSNFESASDLFVSFFSINTNLIDTLKEELRLRTDIKIKDPNELLKYYIESFVGSVLTYEEEI